MTIPVNMSLVTIQGRFILLDGTPMSGQVAFSPTAAVILNRDADVIISGSIFTAPLDGSGFFEIAVPATDDPDLDPTNFTYAVQEPTGRSYHISVPQNVAGGVIDLIDVSPATPSKGQTTILLRGTGIEDIEISPAGEVTVTYDDGRVSNVGNARGPMGATGPQGEVGPQGVQGSQGVQGELGPLGPVGPQGVQGVVGPTGPVGPAGLTWRGVWQPGTDYVTNDAVSFEGASYFASTAPPLNGQDPTVNTTNWVPLSLRGAVGPQGVQGPAGPTGPQGPIGPEGPEGPQGDTGDTGPQGVPGPTGPIRLAADYDDTVPPATLDVISWNGLKYAPRAVAEGLTDHGALSGLSDDDHSQYLTNLRGDARYYTKGQVDSALTAKANTTDPRFSDARTPTAHKTSHAAGGSDVLSPADIGAVGTGDSRLSDARTPVAHKTTHNVGGSDDLSTYFVPWANVGAPGGVPAYNDARLSDARTPVAHKASHATGGGDALSPADIGALATSARGAVSGVASLDTATKVPIGQLPTGATSSTVAIGNDARLSDARTPTAHAASHAPGASDPLTGYLNTTTAQSVAGTKTFSDAPVLPVGTLAAHAVRRDDVRLTDSRVPTAHAASHASGGTDPVSPAAIGAALSGHTHGVVPFAPVTLVEAATVATDASLSTHFRLTLTADRILGAPSNPTDGQRVMWEVTASAAQRTLTLASGTNGSFEFSDAVSTATVVTPSGKTTLFGAIYSLSRQRWTVLGDAVTV